jgi:hypothetical protein
MDNGLLSPQAIGYLRGEPAKKPLIFFISPLSLQRLGPCGKIRLKAYLRTPS